VLLYMLPPGSSIIGSAVPVKPASGTPNGSID
jgi:hypothetical protein